MSFITTGITIVVSRVLFIIISVLINYLPQGFIPAADGVFMGDLFVLGQTLFGMRKW